MRICKKCGKVIPTEKYKKKFCDDTCRSRYYAIKSYNKNKDNPVYKKQSKERFNNWLENNREHFNDLVRENNRLLSIGRRAKYKHMGTCCKCGSKIIKLSFDKYKHKICIRCRLTLIKDVNKSLLLVKIKKNSKDLNKIKNLKLNKKLTTHIKRWKK